MTFVAITGDLCQTIGFWPSVSHVQCRHDTSAWKNTFFNYNSFDWTSCVHSRQSRDRGRSTGEIHFPHKVSVSCHTSLGDLRAVWRAGRKGGSQGSIDILIIALLSPWTWISTFTLTPSRSSRYKTLFLYFFFSAQERVIARDKKNCTWGSQARFLHENSANSSQSCG